MLFFEIVFAAFGKLDQLLRLVSTADRDYQPAADPELLFERPRNSLSTRGDQDDIELTAIIAPAERSIALA